MALQDSDLILVGRGDKSHKITYGNFKTAVNADAAAPGNGQINVNGSNGILANGTNATANQSGNTTRTLSADEAWFNARYLTTGGGTSSGAQRGVVRTISNNTVWDLSTANYWNFAGGILANGGNVVQGQSGLIFVTGAITGFGTMFTNTQDVGATPAIIPYYTSATNVIRLGNPVEVG